MNHIQHIQPTELTTQPGFNENYIENFIVYLDVSDKSLKTYSGNLRQFFYYLQSQAIVSPDRQTILNYKSYLIQSGKSAATVQSYLVIVKLFFEWLEQENLYPNVAKHIKGMKLSKEHKKDYLTADQIKSILQNIDTETLIGKRDYALLTLLFTTGLRTVEVHRAKVGDLRPRSEMTVLYIQGKGHQETDQYVKVLPEVEAAIRAYLKCRGPLKDTDALFSSESNNSKGHPLSTNSISQIVKSTFMAAGYDSPRLTAHSTRHSAITIALLNNESLQQTKEFARHKSINTTLIYSHNLDFEKNTCSNTIGKAIFS